MPTLHSGSSIGSTCGGPLRLGEYPNSDAKICTGQLTDFALFSFWLWLGICKYLLLIHEYTKGLPFADIASAPSDRLGRADSTARPDHHQPYRTAHDGSLTGYSVRVTLAECVEISQKKSKNTANSNKRLKWTVAGIMTAINISVFCIWIPARLQINDTYISSQSTLHSGFD